MNLYVPKIGGDMGGKSEAALTRRHSGVIAASQRRYWEKADQWDSAGMLSSKPVTIVPVIELLSERKFVVSTWA